MRTRYEHDLGGVTITAPVVSGPVTVSGGVVCSVQVPWIEIELLRAALRSGAIVEAERRDRRDDEQPTDDQS